MTFIIDEKAPRIRYRDGLSITFGIVELYVNMYYSSVVPRRTASDETS
jgi:hypothetical protein